MTKEEEKRILSECIQDNKCDKIVELFKGVVINNIRRILYSRFGSVKEQDVEDISQEVFLHIFDNERSRLKLFKEYPESSLAKWISVVAGNFTRNYLRKKGFDSLDWLKLKISIDEEYEISEPDQTSISGKISFKELMAKMSFEERVYIKLYYQYGLKAFEIGDIVGKEAGAVSTKICRIKEKLRNMYEN